MASTKDFIDLQLDPLQAIELLQWWIRVGVTDALDDMPHDRFADSLAGSGGARRAPRASESIHQSSYARGRNRSARASRRRGQGPRDTWGFGARARASGDGPRNAAISHGGVRGLRTQADGYATCVRGWRPWLTRHVSRRGPWSGGRPNWAPLRRQSRAIAGSNAERHWTGATGSLHRERRSMAASGQPNPDAPGDADMSAFHRAADRPRRS